MLKLLWQAENGIFDFIWGYIKTPLTDIHASGPAILGASLSELHTSGTALRTWVCTQARRQGGFKGVRTNPPFSL